MGNSDPEPSPNNNNNISIPNEWFDAGDYIANNSSSTSFPPIAFICGPKNSGKTTFSRYLLNILLLRYKRVAYLDTDVGQPEFTPPGCLSLTIVDEAIPDLTIPCLKTPERCYFFGDISSKRDPKTYLNCIIALYDYYRKELCFSSKNRSPGRSELPLVVNTPGWVKGVLDFLEPLQVDFSKSDNKLVKRSYFLLHLFDLQTRKLSCFCATGIGYDILVDMLKHICPTHVVKINISSDSKNLPAGAFWLDDDCDDLVNLIEISSARKDSKNRSVLVQKEARLIRELRLMAYFRQCFPSYMNVTTIKELAQALASHPPYQVHLPRIKIRHLHCQVPNTEVLYSLNATIVGLAVSPEDSRSLPLCVGLGIVRGIDTLKNLLYVITPVPQSMLARVDLLLQGFIQIPPCLLQVRGCISPYMSANVVSSS